MSAIAMQGTNKYSLTDTAAVQPVLLYTVYHACSSIETL